MQKLPPQLISAFQTTLEELSTASLLMHVIDAESPVFETQISIVNDTLTGLALTDIPILTVVNKSDLLFRKSEYESFARDNADTLMLNTELDKLGLNLISPNENNELIYVSATEGWGINQLRNRLGYEFFGSSFGDTDQV
jgi:50S ribosomal subunit-associated GTPase HflX